jgi:hypothetical protein
VESIRQRQRDESIARDFLGVDVWNAWKRDMDELLAYRKTIHGKPDQYQGAQLAINAQFIDHYQAVLYHSGEKGCTCRSCDIKRKERESKRKASMKESGRHP